MKEVANDKGLKIKIKHINTSKNKYNNMQPKTQNINYNTKKYQTSKIWVQWLLTIVIVEKMSKRE